MLKIIATNAVISKGFDGSPALRFSENGDSVRFRIGCKVYDSRAENNTRWVNLSVKAFGPTLCERIRKMGLKEGSLVNCSGRFDEDSWTDQASGTQKTAPVVILDEVEFAGGSGNGKSKDGQKAQNGGSGQYGGKQNGAGQYGQPSGAGAPGQYGSQQNGGMYGGADYAVYPPYNAGPAAPAASAGPGGNFTGYEAFGGNGSYFDVN